MSAIDDENGEGQSSTFEMICGLTLAVLAAILAITDLGAGKYGADEIIAHNQKANAFDWYQSKGIKQSLVEGQRDMLRLLLDAGLVAADNQARMSTMLGGLDQEIDRYKKEKKEILLGSGTVGEANWVLEQDGERGQIKGAKVWETEAEALGEVGDTFDLATLFLQICLVTGAISLLLKGERLRNAFYGLTIGLSAVGSYFSVLAFSQAGVFG